MLNKVNLNRIVLLIALMGCLACINAFNVESLFNKFDTSNNPLATEPSLIFKGSNDRLIELTYTPNSQYFDGISVYVGRMYFKEEMCIRINERSLWEMGDTAVTMHQHFTDDRNYTLSVDKELFSVQNHMLYWETGLSYKNITDTNGSVIGSYSDLDYCFQTEQLSMGEHMAKIVVKTTSGKSYSYEWEFLVSQAT